MSSTYQTVLCATLFCLALPLYSQAAEQDTSARVLRGQRYQLVYAGAKKVPNFEIDGRPAKIHTQGIYLTDKSLYVTGRLEREPKQALFLRFDRSNLKLLEFLDITPPPSADGQLDHPGGFDYDGTCFWIPVAVSKRHSSTAIVKICTKLDSPLTKDATKLAFQVEDHIGALAFDRKQSHLYGANWDTKMIYIWQPDGTLIKRTARDEFIDNQPNWSLAVQDWKSIGGGILIAGGLDKSPLRERSQPKAVVQWIDIARHLMVDTIRLPSPPTEAHSMTHEGMAVFDGQLFLLPGDLGEDAVLYRYRLEANAAQP